MTDNQTAGTEPKYVEVEESSVDTEDDSPAPAARLRFPISIADLPSFRDIVLLLFMLFLVVLWLTHRSPFSRFSIWRTSTV